MLELSPISLRERFWLASVVAMIMHSLVISVLAMTINYNGISHSPLKPNEVSIEMIFTPQVEGCVTSDESQLSKHAVVCHEGPAILNRPISTNTQPTRTTSKKAQSVSQSKKSSQTYMPTSSDTNDIIPLFNPAPIYPKEARRKGIEGTIMIRASVSHLGTVLGATTLPPHINPILEEAALAAIRRWRFKPGARIVEVPIEFKLET